MSYVIINNNRYEIPEINFDTICELEEMGVNILSMDKNKPHIATTIRGLVAWIMDTDIQNASMEIEAHIANGGNIIEILTKVSDAINKSGFFGRNRQKQPQDHKGKQGGKVKQYPGNNQNRNPQNREQRRASNRHNRNNGNR